MENSIPNFYYITIATKPHFILNKIKEKVYQQNESIIVLGENENRFIGWLSNGNFGIKLKEVNEFIIQHSLKDNDIVLFTDAYDVIYCGNKQEIIRRFLSFEKPLVFGCEKYCNPNPNLERHYKNRDLEFPYLNSGLFIGYVWALRSCMEKYVYDDKHDDQLYWTLQYLNKNNLFALDYNNDLFINTAGMDITKIEWNGYTAKYKNSNPLFIHVNGADKSDLKYFI